MDFADILADLTEFPSLPKTKANRFILEAIRDLAIETWCYTEILTFLTAAGTYEYTLSPSDSATKVIGIPPDGVQFCTVHTPQPAATAGAAGGGLTPGNTYYYKVTSIVDDYGESLPCAAVSLACTATGTINLDWDDIEDADSYYVYQSTDGTNFYYLAEVDDSEYDDDATDTVTTATPPTKSNLMHDISLGNTFIEGSLSSTWRLREGDWIDKIFYDGATTIRLDRIPDTSGMGFQVKVALHPISEISTIPAQMEPYRTSIADFVRGKVYGHPKTKSMPWYDPQERNYYFAQYRRARARLKMRSFAGFGHENRVRPVDFLSR